MAVSTIKGVEKRSYTPSVGSGTIYQASGGGITTVSGLLLEETLTKDRWASVATITDFKPTTQIHFPISLYQNSSSAGTGFGRLSTNGTMEVYPMIALSSGQVHFNFSY